MDPMFFPHINKMRTENVSFPLSVSNMGEKSLVSVSVFDPLVVSFCHLNPQAHPI